MNEDGDDGGIAVGIRDGDGALSEASSVGGFGVGVGDGDGALGFGAAFLAGATGVGRIGALICWVRSGAAR